MKKLVSVLILLAVAGGGGYYYYTHGKTVEKPQVVQAAVSQGDIVEAVQATGTLEALRTVQVGAQVSGTVKELYVDYNSIVKQGQLLAEIDPSLLQVQVEIQNANVERQNGEIASQEVQLEDTKKQLERTQQMFDKGLANQQQLDQAVLSVKTRTTSVDAARKQLLTNQANLSQAKLNVSYTKIYSPIDGVVVNRVVDRGQTVQASLNTPQFFTLAYDLRTLKLNASVDESEIGKVQPGMVVNFSVETYPGVQFQGTVENVRLNATNQNNVVTYPVWINAPNQDLRLRPSMTANLRIITRSVSNVTRVPNAALRFRPTSDMYTALGLTPPTAGQGGQLAGGRRGNTDATAGAPAAAGARGANGTGDEAMASGRTGGQAADAQGSQRQRPQGQAGATAQGSARGQGAGARQGGFGQGGTVAEGGRGEIGQGGQRQRGQGGDGAQGANGQARQGGRGRGQGGQGFGGQLANMTPEERQRMMTQLGGRGQGAGGRGRGAAAAGPAVDLSSADKIDELFAPVPARIQRGQVWTWDESKKELKAIPLQTGVTDGQFSQVITGEVKVGEQIVTNIIVPLTAAQRQQNQSLFGNQPGGRGFGGPQPVQPGAGGFGGPGGGGQGGGGGGGGRRGGGGGD